MAYRGNEIAAIYPITPGEVTCRATHVRDRMDLKQRMIMVVAPPTPTVLMGTWNTR